MREQDLHDHLLRHRPWQHFDPRQVTELVIHGHYDRLPSPATGTPGYDQVLESTLSYLDEAVQGQKYSRQTGQRLAAGTHFRHLFTQTPTESEAHVEQLQLYGHLIRAFKRAGLNLDDLPGIADSIRTAISQRTTIPDTDRPPALKLLIALQQHPPR